MATANLDPTVILHALGITAITEIAAVHGGEDTALWRVTHGGNVSALRVLRAEQRFAAVREAEAMRAARSGGVPVPAIERQGEWEGRPVFMLEWCAGHTVLAALVSKPWRAEAVGSRFERMQARIHAVAAPSALRLDPAWWLQFIASEQGALANHLARLETRTDALIHLDYHPLNVLVGGERAYDSSFRYGSRVVGVLDWTNARSGDPRADIAYTATLLHLLRFPLGVSPLRARTIQQAFIRGWWHGYQHEGGTQSVCDLAPFYAWAGAFIMKDVSPRLGLPGSVVTTAYLSRLRRWIAHWKRRARIA